MTLKRVLLLSGSVCSGKGRVVSRLEDGHSFVRLSTAAHLLEYAAAFDLGGRMPLQALGDTRDEQTSARWVVDHVVRPALRAKPDHTDWCIDAARNAHQVWHLRAFFGPALRHVHMSAPDVALAARYARRARPCDPVFDEVVNNPAERAARDLRALADLTVDTSTCEPDDTVRLALALWPE